MRSTGVSRTWGAVGSYAGGLTGYNSGTITFSDKDNAVSNRSVAGRHD